MIADIAHVLSTPLTALDDMDWREALLWHVEARRLSGEFPRAAAGEFVRYEAALQRVSADVVLAARLGPLADDERLAGEHGAGREGAVERGDEPGAEALHGRVGARGQAVRQQLRAAAQQVVEVRQDVGGGRQQLVDRRRVGRDQRIGLAGRGRQRPRRALLPGGTGGARR